MKRSQNGTSCAAVVFAAPADEAAAAVLHDGPTSGVVCDPGPVGLTVLEAILTRRAPRDVRLQEPVALFNGGQKVVLPLGATLRDEIVKLKGWRASRAIIRWSRSDEVRSERLSAAQTDDLVHDLRELALGATREGHQLYMWIDVDERAMF